MSELNEAQRAAAQHVEGPMMVIAGAGSGKTRVLTYRIAHLIQNGVDPFSILSLTFTAPISTCAVSPESAELISRILVPDPRRRLCGAAARPDCCAERGSIICTNGS